METRNTSLRRNSLEFGLNGTSHSKRTKCKSLFGLFFIQFLLYQLILCYGVYAVYLVNESISMINTAWTPLIFITCFKVTSPWFRDIVESYGDIYYRHLLSISVVCCSFGISINFLSASAIFRSVFYGAVGGVSTSFIRALVQCRILDIFQHKTTLVSSVENFGIAFGMFVTPHFIHFLFDYFENSSYVFLIHGAALLNCLPAGLLLGRSNSTQSEFLTKYKSFSFAEEFGEELVDISSTDKNLNSINKNWKNPSDKLIITTEAIENDENKNGPNEDSSSSQYVENSGFEILPQIPEEDEDESDDDLNVFDKQKFANKVKRLSTISIKLEELIMKDEEKIAKKLTKNEIVLNVNKCDNDTRSEALILDFNSTEHNTTYCCSAYRKHRLKRRIKSLFLNLLNSIVTPLLMSLRIIEFYPCLLLSLHSLLNPMLFLIFMNFKNDRIADISPTEVSFIYSIISFSYLCFLITLPWIVLIPKKNLKYVFIVGSATSAAGIMFFQKTDVQNYVTLSCLIYGLGFGIEYYTRDLVMTNFLGVRDFSKVEGTLECLSGILFLTLVSVVNEYVIQDHINRWYSIIFYSHVIMCCIWTIVPPLIYIYKNIKTKYQPYDVAQDS